MKQFAFLLPLILLLSSTTAIEVGWNHQDDSEYQDDVGNQDEFIVGGAGAGFDLQSSSDSAIRLTNGIFDLYRLLSSDNQKLNQIVSNVKQTVGKDTYAVNHVFKHIKNGNYYLELDTDKYNFAVTFVRMPNTKHVHDNFDHPSTTTRPSTTAEPSKTTPTSTAKTEPSKTTTTRPSTTAEPSKTTPTSTAKSEPSKTTPTSTTKTEPSKTTTRPSTTAEPSKTTPPSKAEPSKTTPAEPSKITPPPKTEPSKTTRPSTTTEPSKTTTTTSKTEPSKTTPPSKAEPSKTTPPSTTKPSPTPSTTKAVNSTHIREESENLRRLEDKRFRQILGQWHLSGVKTGEWFDDVDYKACQVITIYTHGNNYYLKTLNNAGNNTYKMTDDHIESVDKKNSLFKLNNNVYRYKTALLEGKNYKVKLFQLSNLNNSTDVSFYTEHTVDRRFISKVFADHYANLKLFTINQDCD